METKNGDVMPIHFACQSCAIDIEKYLLQNGSDMHSSSYDEKMPINFACEMVKLKLLDIFS